MKKKILSAVCALAMVFGSAAALPEGFDRLNSAITASAATVNATEVTLYYVKEDYKENLSLPADKPTQFQLSVSGATNVTYSDPSSYDNIEVSDTGLITIKPGDMYYWYEGNGGYWRSSEPQDNCSLVGITENIYFGDSVIKVRADRTYYDVTVHLVDYAEECYKPYLQNYIKEHINSSMTDEQKIAAICALPRSLDYSVMYQSGKDLVFAGSGDCWAGTSLNVDIAREMGLEAWGRNANHEGARGHRNAVVVLNGKYYVLEQFGSYWEKDDPYFSFEAPTISTEGTKLYQYDGRADLTSLDIPATVKGKKVVELGEGCFTRSTVLSDLKTLTVPEGVEKIGKSAISNLASLETVTLPSTLTDLGAYNFSGCPNLKNIIISSGNPNYVAKDSMILTKDGTELLYCSGSGDIIVPSTVKKIGDSAFAENHAVTSVTIPESVTEIGNSAFFYCRMLSSVKVLGNGLTTLGRGAFSYSSRLTLIYLPASLTDIDADAVYDCGTGRSCIVCPSGSAIETYAKNNNIKYASSHVSGKVTAGITGTDLTGAAITFTDDDWDPNNRCLCHDEGDSYYVTYAKDFEATVSGSGFSALLPEGHFTMTVSKPGYAPRNYSVTVSGGKADGDMEPALHLIGDITGDGKLNAADLLKAKSHIKGISKMADYEFDCCDVDGNGAINAADLLKMKAHMKGVTPLWT